MRILDGENKEMATYDPAIGYVREEKIIKESHPAVAAAEEQGHYETIREYPNGGKDVEWVVDIAGTGAKEAWTEYEDILHYVPFTPEQLNLMRIAQLKQKLADTDYTVIKIAEGAAAVSDYAEVIASRQAWRAEINSLQGNE